MKSRRKRRAQQILLSCFGFGISVTAASFGLFLELYILAAIGLGAAALSAACYAFFEYKRQRHYRRYYDSGMFKD